MGLDFFIAYAMGRSSAARAERAAASLPSVSGVSIDTVEDLSERINRLVLMSAAMWSIMEENGATQEDLMARMEEIDAADGVLDGRMTPKAHRCAKCDSMIAPGLRACQFCGEPLPQDDAAKPFDSL
ncbi:MAG: hypothetical protein GXP36_06245 [Actinobacteria bacterium]|nr:hypothetical protein [Actinomycetota bacterium]